MTDKEKTAAILDILPKVSPFDRYICVPEFRFGSGYGNTSEKRADLFCISAEKGNKTITIEIKVSRSDFCVRKTIVGNRLRQDYFQMKFTMLFLKVF